MIKYDYSKWNKVEDIFYERTNITDNAGRRIAICMHDYPMSVDTHDKNANLIAMAPELLQVLEEIIDSCEIPYCDSNDLVIKAKNIINKVYGD